LTLPGLSVLNKLEILFSKKTRQEAQTLLNQIAQTRNTLKDQESGTMAMTSGETPTVEMEVINIVTETSSQAAKNNADMGAEGLNNNKISKKNTSS